MMGRTAAGIVVASVALAAAPFAPAFAQCGSTQDLVPCISVPRAPQGPSYFPRASGGRSSVRTYHYGGGGGRTAAAIGAAGAAIGILGAMIEQAEREQNAADAAARQRWAACQRRYRQAYALNEEARQAAAGSNVEVSFAMFERALAVLGSCGNPSDIAVLRHNLENARKDYAALTNPSGSRMYGGDAPKKPLIPPGELNNRAAEACASLTGQSPEWQTCMRNREADLIMLGDDACQSIADADTRNRCVFNRYWASVNGKDPNEFGDPANCYWDEHGNPCHPGGGATASDSADDRNGLRERLKRALDRGASAGAAIDRARANEIARAKMLRDSLPEGSEDRKRLDDLIAKAEAGRMPNAGAAPAQPPPGPQQQQQADNPPAGPDANASGSDASQNSSRDDAYDNYMQGTNTNSGGQNNGDLGHSSFSMSGSETRQEMDRMEGKR